MVEVTLAIPDEIYKHAARLSHVTQLNLSDILADALGFTLPTMSEALSSEIPVNQLDDRKIMTLAESKMPADRDERVGDLLFKQRESRLSIEEAAELLSLMLIYYSGWWRKTEALAEAVKRGLHPPLTP